MELLAFILGAIIPAYLLWQKSNECKHLLNVILSMQKVRTLDRPFETAERPEPKDTGDYKDRRSRPTAIDIALNKAEEIDTKEFLHQQGIQTDG